MAISDQAWNQGMQQLLACCRDRDLPAAMATVRGEAMREDLSQLSDDEWLYAVRVARKREWFPSTDQLLEIVRAAPRSGPTEERLALAPGEAEAQRAVSRAEALEGMRLVRASLAKAGIHVGEAVRDMPDRQ